MHPNARLEIRGRESGLLQGETTSKDAWQNQNSTPANQVGVKVRATADNW